MTQTANNSKATVHHRVRTLFAALFGIIALNLILASILIVWLNRTLTDTTTYVKTVSPLATNPDIQNFITEKTSDQLLKNATPADLAQKLLTPAEAAAKTPDQLTAAVQPIINSSITQIITSPQFATLWRTTNQTAHAQLISQLKTNSDTVTLDLHPIVTGVVNQLQTTKLGGLSDKIEVKPDTGVLNLKGGAIDKAHKFYDWFQKGTLLIIFVTLLAIGLCVLISVHHLKTLRRIVFGTGLIALGLALVLQAPSLLKFGGSDPIQQKAAVAIAKTLFHNLQTAALIIGIVCIVAAVGSKLYAKFGPRKAV